MEVKTWFSLLAILVLVSTPVLGQVQEEPIIVSPSITNTLDVTEGDYYQLFPSIDGVQSAVFYLNADSTPRVKMALHLSLLEPPNQRCRDPSSNLAVQNTSGRHNSSLHHSRRTTTMGSNCGTKTFCSDNKKQLASIITLVDL